MVCEQLLDYDIILLQIFFLGNKGGEGVVFIVLQQIKLPDAFSYVRSIHFFKDFFFSVFDEIRQLRFAGDSIFTLLS